MSAQAAVASAFDRIHADGRAGIWIELVPRERAMAVARALDDAKAAGASLPLLGCTLAVKNNVDVAGIRTTAACPSYGEVPDRHATAVQLLVDAGAVVVGVTNLDQFATGLVGTRSPYGICPNAQWEGLISGGSSSGSAVAVAAAHVDLAVGTDTAGSGRVPAAANGIFGAKPTPGLVSTDGVVPAVASLDCVSLFARDPGLLAQAFSVVAPAAGVDQTVSSRPGLRLGLSVTDALTFDRDPDGPARYEAAVDAVLAATGARAVPVDLAPFVATGALLYDGAFVRERYDAVGAFIDAHPDDVDPVVRSIIAPAASISAAALDGDRRRVAALRAELASVWEEVDVVLVPSVPRLPTVAEVMADPVGVNTMLGTYTNFVNLLGLAACTVPVGAASDDGPPASITLLAAGGGDALLLDLARRIAQEPR